METMMTTFEKVIAEATIEQAREYSATQEQFTFCIDLLGISAHRLCADDIVGQLEDRFEELLARA